MFDNSGKILKVLAVVSFVICIIGGVIALIAFFGVDMYVEGLVALVSLVLSGWIGALGMYALGEASEKAWEAAFYGRQLVNFFNQKEDEKEKEKKVKEAVCDVSAGWNPSGKIPTWQRIEMEREEAARKAAEEAKQ